MWLTPGACYPIDDDNVVYVLSHNANVVLSVSRGGVGERLLGIGPVVLCEYVSVSKVRIHVCPRWDAELYLLAIRRELEPRISLRGSR